MIRVTFACGHLQSVPRNQTGALVCLVCGESRVSRAIAPAPTFTGHCHGPRAVTKDLGPKVVDLTTDGPLKLKPQGVSHD